MFRYFYTDILRVVSKVSFWILALIPGLAITGILMIQSSHYLSGYDVAIALRDIAILPEVFSIFAGIAILISVFHDDFKAKIMSNAIGSGIARFKVFLAKMLEVVFLAVLIGTISAAVVSFSILMLRVDTRMLNYLTIFCIFLTEALFVVAIIALVSPVMFWFQSSIAGIIIYVIVATSAIYLLSFILLNEDTIYLQSYLASHALRETTEGLSLGKEIVINDYLVLMAYIIIPSAVTMILFQYKDLEI